jgi:hypothetical protein
MSQYSSSHRHSFSISSDNTVPTNADDSDAYPYTIDPNIHLLQMEMMTGSVNRALEIVPKMSENSKKMILALANDGTLYPQSVIKVKNELSSESEPICLRDFLQAVNSEFSPQDDTLSTPQRLSAVLMDPQEE